MSEKHENEPKQIPVIDESTPAALIDLTVRSEPIPASGPFGRAEFIQEHSGVK